MSMKRTCAISSSIAFFISAAISLHGYCAKPSLTSSSERKAGCQRSQSTELAVHPSQRAGCGAAPSTSIIITLTRCRRLRVKYQTTAGHACLGFLQFGDVDGADIETSLLQQGASIGK